jgi:hypothetical protein
MPLLPVPGPADIADFANRLRKERGRGESGPQLVLTYAEQEGWLSGSSLNVRASVRVTNVGEHFAPRVAIHVPSVVWLPLGTNPITYQTSWSLGLRNHEDHLDWTPQELVPDQSRFAAVAQIQKDDLVFIGGAKALKTFTGEGVLKVEAVLSWADQEKPARAYADRYEIEIERFKGPPEPGSGFTVKLGLVAV